MFGSPQSRCLFIKWVGEKCWWVSHMSEFILSTDGWETASGERKLKNTACMTVYCEYVGERVEVDDAVTQWTCLLACQRQDDIDRANLSPSVSLTVVTRLFIKMEIESCCSHVGRQSAHRWIHLIMLVFAHTKLDKEGCAYLCDSSNKKNIFTKLLLKRGFIIYSGFNHFWTIHHICLHFCACITWRPSVPLLPLQKRSYPAWNLGIFSWTLLNKSIKRSDGRDQQE